MDKRSPLTTDLLIGWDTVFAIRYSQVNHAIVEGGGTPPELDYADGGYKVFAPFKPWQVVKGGEGHLFRMHLPFTDLSFTAPGKDTKTYGAGYFVIQTELKTVKRDMPGRAAEDGDLMDLVVDFTDSFAGDDDGSGERGAVLDLVCDPMPEKSDARDMKIAMRIWLRENEVEFRHVFATVRLGAVSDVEGLQWLEPTTMAYAFTEPKDEDQEGIFGVLCMTEHREPRGERILDPTIIPKDEDASFAISRERFLSKLLIGGMGYMFTGPAKEDKNKKWPEDYFDLGAANTIIQNNADLRIDNVKLGSDGDEGLYNCILPEQGLQITLTKSHFAVDINKLTHNYYRHLMTWWLDVEHTIECDYVLRVNPDTQVIDLIHPPVPEGEDDPTSVHRVEAFKTKAAEVVEWVLVIVGIVLAFAPVIGRCTGWLATSTSEVAEAVDSASQYTEMTVIGEAEAEQIELLDTEGADEGYFLLNDEPVQMNALSNTQRTVAKSILLSTLTYGAVNFVADYLTAQGTGGSHEMLPKYEKFAARILAPITWPASQTNFTVKDVRIDDCFQTFGTWEKGQ